MGDRLHGLDLFSGVGGLSLALAPWVKPFAYCEIDRYVTSVLLSRMREGSLPIAPIWDDVRSLRHTDLGRARIDIVYGGFPCQDLSDASRGKGKGLDGEQSGLWKEMRRLIDETRPSLVFIENVAGSAWKRYVPSVRYDLNRLGYASMSLCLPASACGAPFHGDRIFIAASNCEGESARTLHEKMARMPQSTEDLRYWGTPPAGALGMANGLPHDMDRLRAMGNAVVPAQAREAFRRLMGLP